MRLFKYALGTAAIGMVSGSLLVGGSLASYVRTGARDVQHAFQDAVPIDFELRRARDLIDEILPELRSQIHDIAIDEVEIARLRSDLDANVVRLEREQTSLAALKGLATETFVATDDSPQSVRPEVVEQLRRKLGLVQQIEQTVETQRQLVQRRQESLDAAVAMLEASRQRKVELDQKVEALAAQHRLLVASQTKCGRRCDSSRLSEADQLLDQLQERLQVATKVLEHEQAWGGEDFSAVDGGPEDSADVLAEVEQYLSGSKVH